MWGAQKTLPQAAAQPDHLPAPWLTAETSIVPMASVIGSITRTDCASKGAQ